MTNSVTLTFKKFVVTIGKPNTNHVETKAVVEQPKPEPKPPFQYWGVVGLLFVAVVYLSAYTVWKRRKTGV